ncbi:MAG: amino acid ABC transporter permease [Brevinema sp.]
MTFLKKKQLGALLNGALLAVLVIIFLIITMSRLGLVFDFSILWQYKARFVSGFKMTMILSACAMILSLCIGFLSVLGIKSRITIISYFFRSYVQIIRGTPLLVQIFFFYYLVGTAWGIENRYIAGILILSLFEGAYITEIIRGGLESIDRQQYDISRAIGLNSGQTFRLVIFPQLFMRILPALTGQFASVIKDSSLLSVVAVIELTQVTQEISAINYALFENYLFLGGLYLLLTMPISLLSQYLEKKFQYAH